MPVHWAYPLSGLDIKTTAPMGDPKSCFTNQENEKTVKMKPNVPLVSYICDFLEVWHQLTESVELLN